MNKILYIVSLSVMIAFIFAPIYTYEEEKVEVNIEEDIATEVSEISEREQEMYDEIVRVSHIEDRKEWFVEYKKLYEKYPEY